MHSCHNYNDVIFIITLKEKNFPFVDFKLDAIVDISCGFKVIDLYQTLTDNILLEKTSRIEQFESYHCLGNPLYDTFMNRESDKITDRKVSVVWQDYCLDCPADTL